MFYNGSNFSYDNFDQGFKYDKINRLKHSNSFIGTPAIANNYKTTYNYDPNGNITNLNRFNGTGTPFDNLSYNYTNGSTDNKLTQITDAANPATYVGDLETQSNANNYDYDASGNLTKDESENISSIEWTPDGKIKKITKAPVEIEYLYDAMGQRVTKNVTTTTMVIPEPPLPPDPTPVKNRKQTIYARDANGQVMAIYEREFNPNEPNNPGPRLKFRLIMEWITHGCPFELEIEEGVDFEYVEYPPGVLHLLEIETKADKYYSFNCFEHSYSFMLSAGTTINLAIVNDPILGNNVILGYRQPNLTGKYSNGMPKFLTAYIDGNQASMKINSISSKISYTNTSMLPKLAEWHVYGNEQQGRFLTKYPEQEPTYYGQGITEDIRNNIFSRQLGKKAYELKDHLGNVRVTFSDIKIPTDIPNQPFRVDLLSKSEYYPYGMLIDDLSFNLSYNRYGFGGTHELDNEVKGGVGNHLSFGDFGYDTRVARRFNLDPIDQIFISNYAGFGNNPIYYTDPSGYEIKYNDAGQAVGYITKDAIVEADKTSSLENIGSYGIGVLESTLGTAMNVGFQLLTNNQYIPNEINNTVNTAKAIVNDPGIIVDGATNAYNNFSNASAYDQSRMLGNVSGSIGVGLITPFKGSLTSNISKELLESSLHTATISVKTSKLVMADQYFLLASKDGMYPIMKRGFKEPVDNIFLKQGEKWKIGKTINPDTRYTNKFLEENNLRFVPNFKGTELEALKMENFELKEYIKQNGKLPPGNKIKR